MTPLNKNTVCNSFVPSGTCEMKSHDLVKFLAEIWLYFTDPFSRGFREGISFPNILERSIPGLPLSKLCAVPFALQNRALFEGEKMPRKGEEEGWPAKGAKRKKGRAKTGQWRFWISWISIAKLLTFAAGLHLFQMLGDSEPIRNWGNPKPLHLKPGHLKLGFFSARRCLD